MPAVQVNFRIDPDILERIDANALRQGVTRTEYLLQYLPETYEQQARTTSQHTSQAADSDR